MAQDIVLHLNKALTHTLTGINQYFLHARILKYRGLMKLADYEYKQSIDFMKSADLLVNRVLGLGGLPNLQDLGRLMIGATVEEILACDMALQDMALAQLKEALNECKKMQDAASADILQKMLENAAEHSKFVRSQLNVIETVGLDAYIAQTQNDITAAVRKPAA
jgi:bacterioferritin